MSAHIGDIGTIVRYTTDPPIVLTGAEVLTLKVKNPDGILKEWPALVFEVYSAQYITTLITDLDKKGEWEIQLYAELASGWIGHSDIQSFEVLPNIPFIPVEEE